MEKSENIDALAKALKEFQKSAPNVTKDAKANYGKYATLGNVIETVREGLAAQGLSFAQFPEGEGLTTVLMHESGQWISATGHMKLDKQTAQGLGSAITYSRRYGLSAVLGLATDDDDDGNTASKPAADAKPAAPKKPAAALAGEAQEKAEIQRLALEKYEQPFFSDREELVAFIKQKTGLVYGEAKNADIIERLKTI